MKLSTSSPRPSPPWTMEERVAEGQKRRLLVVQGFYARTFRGILTLFRLAVVAWTLANCQAVRAAVEPLRPPAAPLVACDPYFSVWSPADKLTDADTMHWTGKPHRLESVVRVDGREFRVLGANPAGAPALPQTGLEVTPTRTIYTFTGQGVQLTLTFMTPALPDDLMIYSRPVTYVTYSFSRTDERDHQVSFHFAAHGEIARNDSSEAVVAADVGDPGADFAYHVVRVGTQAQPVLRKKGDDLRIDWGWLYLAGRADQAAASHPAETGGAGAAPSCVARLDFIPFQVSAQPVSRTLILAYDDEFGLQYFKKNLRPYWRRNGDDALALLRKSAAEYVSLARRCAEFDAGLMADLRKVGGEKYARLCALAYRQIVAGAKIVADENGAPLLFPKENTSNGCIGTVDVIYPLAPFCLLFGPSLTKAMLVPPLDYGSSPRWRFPFAPHDLGTYPLANGQVYGGGERTEEDQMPVEESANLIILVTALAEREGNAEFAAHYWPVLTRWAAYLKEKGFDPERQLCTDDFAGHLAHNVNLSAKAIVALGAYGKLCELRGQAAPAREFTLLARQCAERWAKEADDGDHFRLAFDQPGTWSQKYNLIWDRVLRLQLFAPAVLRKEMDYYPRVMRPFGLPLDNRKAWAELPWSFWTAALTGEDADFHSVFDPIYDYVNATPSRVPFPDFYWTDSAKEAGMHARPVLGGIFMQLLLRDALAQPWFRRDATKAAHWAPPPTPPNILAVLPAADSAPALWRYTVARPGDDWFRPEFNDGSWSEGKSGFGTAGTPGGVIGTTWNTGDIWLRREVELPAGAPKDLQGWLHHDEDAEVYFNGVPAMQVTGWSTSYEEQPLTEAGVAALKPGKNLLAIHCHQTTGGQYIDFGLIRIEPPAATQ